MDEKISKKEWNEFDFESMDFHDVRIYGICFEKEHFQLVFDIDYIFEWRFNSNINLYDEYLVASASLAFENYTKLLIDIESDKTYDIIIDSIKRHPEIRIINSDLHESSYEIKLNCGLISFCATNFIMKLKSEIKAIDKQELGLNNR